MATVAASLLELFKNNKHYDVTFKVRCGKSWSSFSAHKLVLSIWSPVFAGMFQRSLNALNEEVEIVDIRPSTFHVFLNYLYGYTKELEREANDIKFVLDVYEAASKYQVQRLTIDCCEILNSSSPNKDNVFDLIEAAILISSNTLKERCYNILQSETEAILQSQDIQAVTTSMVLTLLQLPSLWLTSANELFTWVFKWAKSHCLKQNINNPRDFISPFLPYLNFTALKSEELAILVNNHREFFDEVECFYIFMNINLPESTKLPVWFDRSKNSCQYEKPLTAETSSVLTVDNTTQTDEAVDSNNEGANDNEELGDEVSTTLNDTSSMIEEITKTSSSVLTVDNTTQTDEAVDTNNEELGDEASAILNDTSSIIEETTTTSSELAVDNATQTDEAAEEIIITSSSVLTVNNATQTDEAVDTNKEELCNEASAILNDTSSIMEETTTSSSVDTATQTDEAADSNKEELDDEALTTLTDTSSMIEETERGQVNSVVLETIDKEPGESWDSLEPPINLEKIKKKKIKKFYWPPEGKSLPNIGQWDSVLESPFLSGDFKSMSLIIEKQCCLPIAADILRGSCSPTV